MLQLEREGAGPPGGEERRARRVREEVSALGEEASAGPSGCMGHSPALHCG